MAARSAAIEEGAGRPALVLAADHIVDCFKDGFPGMAASDVRARILRDNQRNFTPSDELRDGWSRFVIQEGTVDLFEAMGQLVAST